MLTELALKATVLIALAGLASAVLRRSSAANRHLVWLSALSALVILPLTIVLTPAWRPGVPQAEALAGAARTIVYVTAAAPAKSLPWSTIALACWAMGALVLLARTTIAQIRASRLVAQAKSYRPGVAICGATDVPLVAGLVRPLILLPETAAGWQEERLDLVLRHESAHVSRMDTLSQLIGDIASALYWPLPWVWLASRRLRTEAELACDDGVLLSGLRASEYAGHLIDIVRGLSGRERIPQGGIPMARLNQLELRLHSMLAHNVNRGAATPRTLLAAALGAAMLLIPVSALHLPAVASNDGVNGSVKDASGATVPKAKVAVQFTNSSRREVGYTNEVGEFSLAPLPDGVYDVTVAKPGFALLMTKGIEVAKGASVPLVLVLQTGKVSEPLTVSAQGPVAANPPSAAGGMPTRISVGGNVQAIKLVKQPRPSYPPECKAAGIQGSVMLRAVIGKDGTILNLEQVNELVDRRLVDAAMEAVRQWQYQPTLLNGNPVEVMTEVEVNFTLNP
jgi:TonB family protein